MASVAVTSSGQRQDVPATQGYHEGPSERAGPGPLEVHHGPPERAAPGPSKVQAIFLSGITVQFRGRTEPAVDGLGLTIPTGEICGLLGPNGSGKTTTISVIVGLRTPGSGDVEVFSGDPRSQATRRDLGVLIQQTALYPELTGRANLDFYASLYGYTRRARRARVDAMLELANLERYANQRVSTYSGGMARRLAIGRALLHSPKLLVFDEPTVGVDTTERAELWRLFRLLPEVGKTVLLTTNVLEEAEALCDRVAIMREGRLVTPEPASPEYLRAHYGAMVVTIRAQASQEARQQSMAALGNIPEITAVQDTTTDAGQGEFVIQATSAQREITGQLIMLLARNGVEVRDVDKRLPSLEEVFRLLTTGPLKADR